MIRTLLTLILVTGCDSTYERKCSDELVLAVGGCDKGGWCGVATGDLLNPDRGEALYPVAGIVSRVCRTIRKGEN